MPPEILDHPVAVHSINQLRRRETPPEQFRRHCDKVTTFLAIAATRDLCTRKDPFATPLEETDGDFLDTPVAVVAILRAGAGMVDSVTRLLPDVAVGYVGLERDEETAEAHRYYHKLPPLAGRRVLVVDPMLATGGSAEQALRAVQAAGAEKTDFLCIVAAPEGIRRLEKGFPSLRIFAGAVDRGLDPKRYIRPGLGDFGDRLYGT
ncbi:MAG: uracil phosphoribosyltransferase [Verrucomicrobia bacterium]|jgi:uracil phosphoribosyltransferase|nr:uracil phosphoribosyltransferase [Verrucomicrobiota bacterium]